MYVIYIILIVHTMLLIHNKVAIMIIQVSDIIMCRGKMNKVSTKIMVSRRIGSNIEVKLHFGKIQAMYMKDDKRCE